MFTTIGTLISFMVIRPTSFFSLIKHLVGEDWKKGIAKASSCAGKGYNLYMFNFRFLCYCKGCDKVFINELTEAELVSLRGNDHEDDSEI